MQIRKLEEGFSFIEVLASMVILADLLVGVLVIYPICYRQVSKAGRINTISHLAYRKMDQLKTLGYGNIALTGSGTWPGQIHSDSGAGTPAGSDAIVRPGYTNEYYYPVPDPGTSDPPGNELQDYSLRWTVINDKPIANMKTVTIEVGYGISYGNAAGAYNPNVQRQNSFLERFQFYMALP